MVKDMKSLSMNEFKPPIENLLSEEETQVISSADNNISVPNDAILIDEPEEVKSQDLEPIQAEVIETPKEQFDINSKEGQDFIKQYSKDLKNRYSTSFEIIKSDTSLSSEERKSKYKAELDNYKKDLEEFESAIFEAQKNFDIPVAFAQGWMGTGKGVMEAVKMPAAQGIDLALRLFDP